MAVAEATASALTPPQYGTGSKHAHAKAGGGSHTHSHDDAAAGHQHAADSEDNGCGVALLPVPAGAVGKSLPAGFRIHLDVKARTAGPKDDYPSGTLLLEGYANTWATDRDKERFARSAFDSAIGEYMLNPVILDNHDDARAIGYMETAQTDDLGLRVKGVIPPPPSGSETWHVKAYHDVKTKVRRAMSVGGIFIRSKSVAGLIEGVKWYETSIIAVPANQYSIFEVAATKGLHFKSQIDAAPGADPENEPTGDAAPPRRRNGTHGHRNGIRHRHLGGSRSHRHATAKGATDDWTWKAADPAPDTADDDGDSGVDALQGADLPALIDALAAGLTAIIDGDQSDDDKVDNIDSLLDEFADAAGDILGGDDELPDDEDAAKWVTAFLDAKTHSPSGRQIKTALARVSEETNVAGDTANKDEGQAGQKAATLDDPGVKAMLSRLQTLEDEKAERDEEAKAAKLAEDRLADEQKAAEELEAKQKEADARVGAMVEKRLAELRGTKKFRHVGALPTPGDAKSAGTLTDWLMDIKAARRGDHIAFERVQEQHAEAVESYGLKALVGGTSTAGGFLVPPQYWQQGLAEFRIAAAKVRPLCTVVPNVNSNLVYIPRETGIAAVGWTAENATKPSQDQNFGQIAINLFTLAGISKVSNQLLEDSSPAVDTIVRKDLGRMIGQAEDIAFIDGTGVGQPTGVLRTNGVLTVAYTDPGARLGSGLGDAVSAAITAIQSNYFGDPTAIVAHPRNVAKLRQVKDSNGRYVFEAGFDAQNSPFAGGAGSLLGGSAQLPQAVGSIWGLPVISDANVPTNYSGTTPGGGAESPLIVADWSEAYVLERSGFTIDVSNEAGTSFEQNQTWFRGEERLGFTAARQPTAFCYVTGLGPAING